MFCRNCGARLSAGDRFCGQCGQGVSAPVAERQSRHEPTAFRTPEVVPANADHDSPAELGFSLDASSAGLALATLALTALAISGLPIDGAKGGLVALPYMLLVIYCLATTRQRWAWWQRVLAFFAYMLAQGLLQAPLIGVFLLLRYSPPGGEVALSYCAAVPPLLIAMSQSAAFTYPRTTPAPRFLPQTGAEWFMAFFFLWLALLGLGAMARAVAI